MLHANSIFELDPIVTERKQYSENCIIYLYHWDEMKKKCIAIYYLSMTFICFKFHQ